MADTFSTEVPGLLNKHLEQLKASDISIEVIRERGYITAMGKTALRGAHFGKAQQRAPGILMPLHGVDGKPCGHQYRPDDPRTNQKGKVIKYENPVGSSVRIDVPPRCRQQLGNPNTPLWITEGVKKADSLASHEACAAALTGVWGFKGKNIFGGTTLLADFDYIALKDRLVYLVFDSDIVTKPPVQKALERLSEHLGRKGARVRILQLPGGPDGEKVGVDDYLAQGRTTDDLIALEVIDVEVTRQTLREKSSEQYCIDDGRYCWIKQTPNGPVEVPLCNFTARVVEDILRDNGLETSRLFRIAGFLGSGGLLPIIEVPSSSFSALSWVTSEWGMKTIIAAGQTYKDRLREAIQLQSQDAEQKVVFTHTGWREVDGKPIFLTAAGAMGNPAVQVDLDPVLRRYRLPEPAGDISQEMSEGDIAGAIKTSFEFLFVASPEVSFPLWSAMYLSPLSESLQPAFTIWLVGPSGGFKSTLSALALSHFGDFDEVHLPASWRDTANQLEKLLFLAKDVPLVIDDWAPGQDSAKARELEVKAEYVIRAQANRQGRGRMRSDTSSRTVYIPRGLLLTSGEQLPGGHSHTARIYSVEIEPSDVNIENLTGAQGNRHLYPLAMAGYITWLSARWAELRQSLPETWRGFREKARQPNVHPRMPAVIAWLYIGLYLATEYAQDKGVMTDAEVTSARKTGWEIFHKQAAAQAQRVEAERPGERFMDVFSSMVAQGKVVFSHKDEDSPKVPAPGTYPVGWYDNDGNILLNAKAAYAAVSEFCQRSGNPFTFKEEAVWKDLKRMDVSVCQEGRTKYRAIVYGRLVWVVKIHLNGVYRLEI